MKIIGNASIGFLYIVLRWIYHWVDNSRRWWILLNIGKDNDKDDNINNDDGAASIMVWVVVFWRRMGIRLRIEIVVRV